MPIRFFNAAVGGAPRAGPGVRAHDVEPTEVRYGEIDEALYVSFVPNISLVVVGRTALIGDFLLDRVPESRSTPAESDFCALSREGDRCGSADS